MKPNLQLPEPSQGVNVLMLRKGAERFVWIYTDAEKVNALRSLGRFATDAGLAFSWHDAAVMSREIREQAA